MEYRKETIGFIVEFIATILFIAVIIGNRIISMHLIEGLHCFRRLDLLSFKSMMAHIMQLAIIAKSVVTITIAIIVVINKVSSIIIGGSHFITGAITIAAITVVIVVAIIKIKMTATIVIRPTVFTDFTIVTNAGVVTIMVINFIEPKTINFEKDPKG